MKYVIHNLVVIIILFEVHSYLTPPVIEDEEYLARESHDQLKKALSIEYSTGVARNIILGIGDGMGISTVTAARILDGQNRGHSGEENFLHFEHYPHVALIKTYSLDYQVTDSSGSACAILTGLSQRSYTMGLNTKAVYNNCSSVHGNEITSILDWSLRAGKSVGIVTTDRVTAGTPAASYAHTASRYWENDVNTPAGCKDIARQLVEDNPEINVILGGGRHYFIPSTDLDGDAATEKRNDGRNLINEWKDRKILNKHKFSLVNSSSQLDKVRSDTDYLLGLFTDSKFPHYDIRTRSNIPTLPQMVKKAIEILSKNKNGFFLLIEGSLIDTYHHYNQAQIALQEAIEFSEAVHVADNMTSDSDTLILVTADHSHVFTISGYPKRGNPILSLTNDIEISMDGKPETTLGYGNGPGWRNRERPLVTLKNLEDPLFRYTGGRPLQSEAHGGEDVAAYAKGPMAHLIHGVHEQSYIGQVLGYAACLHPLRSNCPVNVAKTIMDMYANIAILIAIAITRIA